MKNSNHFRTSFSLVQITALIAGLVFSFTPRPLNAKNENRQTVIASAPVPAIEKTNEGSRSDKQPRYREGEVIVKYKDGTINLKKSSGDKKAKTFRNSVAAEKLDEIENLNAELIKSTNKNTQDLVEELKNRPEVEYAEPNYLRYPMGYTPDDLRFTSQWALNNTGQTITTSGGPYTGTNDADIDAPEAWDIEQDNSASPVTVAVIDTGVDYTHEDLAANMWDGTACKTEFGTNQPGGCPNHGWDFLGTNPGGDSDPFDNPIWPCPGDPANTCGGHGTNVAGIIGAVSGNGTGGSGLSRYNSVKIMALRFDLTTFAEARAIDFARYNGAKVINASFGSTDFSQLEYDALAQFPGIIAAAAGNSAINTESSPLYPCNYDLINLVCVGSAGMNNQLSDFSNYSQTHVDVAAPGELIYGPIPAGMISNGNPVCSEAPCYVFMFGTSQATPHVAGLAALVWNQNPTLSIEKVRSIILNSGDAISTLAQTTNTGRRINLRNALMQAQQGVTLSANASVYRFWSDQNQGHFYTSSIDERNYVMSNYPSAIWNYEGEAYYAIPSAGESQSPVYRFWSDKNQGHFYTISEEEKNYIENNYPGNIWRYEGIAWYAYADHQTDTTPVYRFWSDQNQGHFYTTDINERNLIIALYSTNVWKYEGIAWYVPIY